MFCTSTNAQWRLQSPRSRLFLQLPTGAVGLTRRLGSTADRQFDSERHPGRPTPSPRPGCRGSLLEQLNPPAVRTLTVGPGGRRIPRLSLRGQPHLGRTAHIAADPDESLNRESGSWHHSRMQTTPDRDAPAPTPLTAARVVPIVIATAAVGIWALWMVQWLLALALFSDGSLLPQTEGVRTIEPTTGDVAVSIVRHVGPLLMSGAMLLLTLRSAHGQRDAASWLFAILAFCAPVVFVLL